MTKLGLLAAGVAVAGAATVTAVATRNDDSAATTTAAATLSPTDTPSYTPDVLRRPAPVANAEVDKFFDEAARAAWHSLDRGYVARTGLIMAQPEWPYPTLWDVASTLGAYYSAHHLGLLPEAQYQERVTRALQTLNAATLYDGIAFGRNYDARTGQLIGPGHEAAGDGTGFSAIDLGRLLVWLKIVAQDDKFAALATDVAGRLNAGRIVRDGYMQGETLPKEGKLMRYQEGRIGYEQYAATGFQLWGFRAQQAAKLRPNARLARVQNIPLYTDRRGLDRLTSDPLVLYAMEVGRDPDMRELTWQALALQAQRFKATGQITIAGEDAVAVPPYYFYYYCIYCGTKPFVVNVHAPGKELQEPRWISTKSSFAWHAIMPSEYTWQALQALKPALDGEKGWATGVYEKTGKSTDTYALNTAAVILEAALYRRTNRPFLQLSSR